ncbi:MAG: ABC transporter permease [Alphaproteobacteria bacterium]|nr:ABC transporter permease [Alphaproteobacteria bacterium]
MTARPDPSQALAARAVARGRTWRPGLRNIGRTAVTIAGLLLLWQTVVWATGVAPYILPAPRVVANAWLERPDYLLTNAAVTAAEMLLGLLFGGALGVASAILIATLAPARRWLLPVLVISQAIPVFALAPILMLWFGYGMASKVVMATLLIYFPVTAAFLDGLRRTEPGWLDLAQVMTQDRWAVIRHVRIPAALPALASGIRVATAMAAIGAVVGEWVGSGAGLGFVMLHANGRAQTDLMFAALATLAALALVTYYSVDWGLRRALPWTPDSPLDDARF